jgi:hypothetical protein
VSPYPTISIDVGELSKGGVMKRAQHIAVAEMEISVPSTLRNDLYQAGYVHAMRGGRLNKIEYFKLSFREGFRAAKLQMRHERRKEGIIDFPLHGRMKIKSL